MSGNTCRYRTALRRAILGFGALALGNWIAGCGGGDASGSLGQGESSAAAGASGTPTGWIDPIQWSNGAARVVGWACLPSVEQSVDVHLYADGPYGRGHFLTGANANQSSEPAVGAACGTTHTPHRFSVDIAPWSSSHAGQAIWVHAIHPSGIGPNPTIAQSGVYAIPQRTELSTTNPAGSQAPATSATSTSGAAPTTTSSGNSASDDASVGEIFIRRPSGGDDRPTIQQAIDEAIARRQTTVILGAGRYQLRSGRSDRNAHLVFEGGQGVGIRGQSGASVELVMGDLTKHGIAVHGTEDFTLQNIAIDWQQHTLGQGTVHSIDTAKKKVWVHNDAGFLTWDDGFFDEATATVYLRRTARQQTPPQCLLLPAADQPPAWGQANGLNWFRYQDFSNCPAGLAPGQKVVLNKNSWTSVGLHMVRVQGALIEDVTMYSAPGPAVINQLSERGSAYPQINFVRFAVRYHPSDASRMTTTNADGIHSTGSRAAIIVRDSHFEGIQDDAINLHVRTGRFIGRWQSGDQWIIAIERTGGWGDWRVGDLLHVFNPKQVVSRCSLEVQSAPYTNSCGGYTCINVSPPLYGTSCTDFIPYDGTNAGSADLVANQNLTMDWTANQPSIIENTTFLDNSGRAILNRVWNTIIRHNTLGSSTRHSTWCGIYEGWGSIEGHWAEGTMVTPATNPTQQIYGNGGRYGDTICGCLSNCP
jgi:hypothetical protein